jgi:hypothetical protein
LASEVVEGQSIEEVPWGDGGPLLYGGDSEESNSAPLIHPPESSTVSSANRLVESGQITRNFPD